MAHTTSEVYTGTTTVSTNASLCISIASTNILLNDVPQVAGIPSSDPTNSGSLVRVAYGTVG
jgi:hypothetical protein